MVRFSVLRSRFPVIIGTIVLGILSVPSCGNSNADDSKNVDTSSTLFKNTTPPFTIDVLPGFHVEEDVTMVGRSYHYRSDDPTNQTDELGVYVGNLPDTTSPPSYSAKREYRDVFYGDSVKWREFITTGYTFREVVVAKDSVDFVHSWCYSKDSTTLAQLTGMMKSIRPR